MSLVPFVLLQFAAFMLFAALAVSARIKVLSTRTLNLCVAVACALVVGIGAVA